MRENWLFTMLFVPFGVMAGAWIGIDKTLSFGLVGGLVGGLIVASIGMVLNGWARTLKERSTQPNQGIRASIRNGINEGVAIGLVGGLNIGLGSWLISSMNVGLSSELSNGLAPELVGWHGNGLVDGLVSGLVGGLSVGLFGGIGEALKHYLLRILLWREGGLPLRLIPFLEDCRSRLLLRRQGGAYMFWHKSLQDYFAELDDARLAELAKRIEAKPVYEQSY